MKQIVATLLIFSCFISCQPAKEAPVKPNIILMIGDGMGVTQVTAATYWNPRGTSFHKFKTVGLSETSSTSSKVTDSAAGATAIASGKKTYNRAIGVAADSTKLKTILEELQEQGYQTGLISLTTLTHATPACFYAHVIDRDMHEEIAEQLVTSKVDFLAGGGWQYLVNRADKRNLYLEMQNQGYEMDTTALPATAQAGKRYAFLLAPNSLPSKVQGREDFLEKATALALDYFRQSDKPYFLMVEGSYIDWGGHANDAQMVLQEAIDFDQTIGTVLEKTAADPATLVVVTADHETGGVAIGKYYTEGMDGNRTELRDTLSIYFNTDQHTATLVPVFAKGHQEALFGGVYANNEIYHKLKEACSPGL